jgi:hypothetical protein
VALARVKTWIAGEVLTASDLNAEVNNVLNNGADLVSPFTKAISLGGFALNFDAANTMSLVYNTKGLNLSATTAINDVFTTVASATTPDIWTMVGGVVNYTGTVTATGFASAPQAGARRVLVCSGAAPFTAGANFIIAGIASGSTYTAAANDQLLVTAITTTQFLLVPIGSGSVSAARLASSSTGFSIVNGTLVPSNNATQLTIAIKTLAGNDPSASDPVYVLFRNVTAGTGDYAVITLTAATSIQTTVGGTFGVANSVSFRLWIVGFNDGGTFRLGLINCLTTVAGTGTGRDVTAIFPLAGWGIASSTQIGAGSTSASTFYTNGAAASSKAYTTIGYLTYESGVATAGTFTANPSRLQLFNRNSDPLPGQVVQVQRNDTGAVATGTTVIPNDDTIPQNTEGDQYMSQAFTPGSAANAMFIETTGYFSPAVAATIGGALFQDAVANAIAVSFVFGNNAVPVVASVKKSMLAATTSSITFKLRAGPLGATTITFNGVGGARVFGGVINSFIEAREVMG